MANKNNNQYEKDLFINPKSIPVAFINWVLEKTESHEMTKIEKEHQKNLKRTLREFDRLNKK